ncbi:MAG: diguanylate cyclase, partial [Steroidobacteraceae bacterium]
MVRGLFLAWVFGSVLSSAAAATPAFDVAMLDASAGDPAPAVVANGSLDARFGAYDYREARVRGGPFWLRLTVRAPSPESGAPALVIARGRHLAAQVFAALPAGGSDARALSPAALLPAFSGVQDVVYALPSALATGEAVYARVVAAPMRGAEVLQFGGGTLDRVLARGAEHTRMVALAFGALMAMATAAILIWLVLKDRLFVLYSSLFALQALYIAYLSGQGFDWPWLSIARPLTSHAWNVPAALSGAAACLFVREIADLRRFSVRVHRVFGWFAAVFTVLAFANFLSRDGFGGWLAAIGNVVFVGTAIFTLVIAFLAWRRGSRPAGWFLLAWVLLEAFTVATALRLLFTGAEGAEFLLYYGLPLSMVAAAVLIALGVADRLREQRVALSEAERRAQTDALTGVLNRRSLIARLDAACARAQARGLPIALLFIDLDHFKQINDTWGHQAGDACLAAIIPPIQAELRHSDVVGRYGGEEFVV